jgi:ParB family chromosome partitioning protein
MPILTKRQSSQTQQENNIMERKALGKGISALIPERTLEEKGEKINYIKLEQIQPSPLQPRKDFDSQHMDELTQSIKEKGVIQPLLLRRRQDHYEIIAGERRFRAAKLLNLNEIPAIIKDDIEDHSSLELSLIENIQRQNLNPIEEARAYQYLIDKFKIRQEAIAEALGKARASIANILRLLKLPHEIQQEIIKGSLSFAHGRALLEVERPDQQHRLAQQAIAKKLSVRELENLIKRARVKAVKPRRRSAQADPFIAAFEQELQRILATKVRISRRKKRGYIVIEFYSQEDLERILSAMK